MDEDAFIAAILDCKSICTSLAIIPRGEIVNGSFASDFMQESEEIIRDDPEPKKGVKRDHTKSVPSFEENHYSQDGHGEISSADVLLESCIFLRSNAI